MDTENLRTSVVHDSHGHYTGEVNTYAWRCNACAVDMRDQEVAEEAERARRNPSTARFLEAMHSAGLPGAQMMQVAAGRAFSEVGGELQGWPIGTTRESAPTQAGSETVSWYLGEDGVTYERSVATQRKRFGKAYYVPALVQPSGRYGISELGPVLFELARKYGVDL